MSTDEPSPWTVEHQQDCSIRVDMILGSVPHDWENRVSSVIASYSQAFRGQFGRLPVWLPGTNLGVGDVGVLIDSQWRKLTSLVDLRIPFEVETGLSDFDYALTTSADVQLAASAAVTAESLAAPNSGGKIDLSFNRAGAFIFLAHRCRLTRVGNLIPVREIVLSRFSKATWEIDWIIATAVVKAVSVVSAVSAGSNGRALLSVGVGLDALTSGEGPKLGADARFLRSSEMAATFVSKNESAVMFEGWRVKKTLFGGNRLDVVRGPDRDQELDIEHRATFSQVTSL